jgi:hypothetical protein
MAVWVLGGGAGLALAGLTLFLTLGNRAQADESPAQVDRWAQQQWENAGSAPTSGPEAEWMALLEHE